MTQQTRRLTRRESLRLAAGLAAGALLAASCQPAPTPTPPPAPTKAPAPAVPPPTQAPAPAAPTATAAPKPAAPAPTTAPAKPAPAPTTAPAPAAKAPAAAGKVRLKWWSHPYKAWNDELTRQKITYEGMNPSIEITYTVVAYDELYTKFTTAMLAGTGPELMGAQSTMTPNLMAGNWLAEAPKEVADDIKTKFFPVCVEGVNFNGKIYGYNQHIGGILPIINTEAFEAAKVEAPKSWADMLKLTQTFDKQSGGKYTQAVGNFPYTSWVPFVTWGTILKSMGGDILSDDAKSIALNNDIGRAATEEYLKYVHPEMGAENDTFGQGKSFVYFRGPWIKAFLDTQFPKLKYKAIPVLQGSKARIQKDYVWNWVISKAATDAQKEAGWTFLGWLNNVANQVSMVKASALIPTTKASLEHPDVANDPWVKTFVGELAYKTEYAGRISNWVQVEKVVNDELALLATKVQSVNDTLKKIETEGNKLLKESKVFV
ncbi:MAG: extracellular solute-binding protein [Chloroflexi bacterium]|nr:extracellular solute-binding protein [Chloroflexota bacterium]